jgi:hypothetical protein
MKRLRNRGPARVFGLAALLLVVALAVGACVTPTPAAPAATTAPATSAQAPAAPATSAPAQTPASSEPIASSNLPAGVDAEGNYDRADPKATVKLTEFSDFQ